ncbi:MAG: ABC transporter permease, partial [Vicinamibacterales bacterium]
MIRRILNLVPGRRERLDHDLDRELLDHVERRIADLVKDGLSEVDARRQAHIELGGVTQVQEGVRDTWTMRWLDAFVADARYAMRGLVKQWGFSFGTVSVLALAIGATAAIFSTVNTVLLQPLAYPDADRIVSIETFATNTGRSSPEVSGPDFLDWQAQSNVFEKMAVSYGSDDFAATVGDRAVFANARYVSADFFAVFGQRVSAGRLIAPSDIPARDAEPTVAVVAHHWATTHFGNAQAAVGKTISVYGTRLEIIGVAAPAFRYPRDADLWAPWLIASGGEDRSNHNYQAVGKLAPGVDFARAQAQMRTIGDNIARQYPENRLKSVSVVSLHERVTGNLQTTLWVLMSAVGVVWLIACANIANLLIARAAGRAREIALRAALGAGRCRVVRQLLTESCVLAGVSGLAGLLLASLLVRGFVALSPTNLARIHDVQIDMTVVLFALGLSLASTVLVGVVPALHASRFDLADALKQGGSKATVSKTSARLRSFLVVTEVALSVILLAAAGLLVRSFRALHNVDLGFTTNRVLVAYTDYAVNSNAEILARSRVYADLLDRLRTVPGVSAAGG